MAFASTWRRCWAVTAPASCCPMPRCSNASPKTRSCRDVKIIAEAWDAAGAYEVGSFSERRWAEWNGRYRDDVRRFWRGDDGMLGLFASRICGSADIYAASGKGPESSINFVTCHDGFTLNDLVSYRAKHNEANGEDNRDGTDANFSENYGAEGETTDAGIEAVRNRQIKNFLLTLLISRGVPMLLGGDEFRRTQGGNNNAYCQDNETSWYDWTCLERHQEIYRFARGLIAFRRSASDSGQGAVLHRRRDRMVRPARRIARLDRPERKAVWLSGPRRRAERLLPAVQCRRRGRRLPPAAHAGRRPLAPRNGHLSQSAARFVRRGRGAALGQRGAVPRRAALSASS